MADELQFWLEDHAVPVFVLLGAALAVVAFLAFRGPSTTGSDPDLSETEIARYDAQATEALRDAQVQLDAYAEAHGGVYDGAAPGDIEASIPPDARITDVEVDALADSVSTTLTSGSGGAFTLTRQSGGALTFTCSAPGIGACSDQSTWGEP